MSKAGFVVAETILIVAAVVCAILGMITAVNAHGWYDTGCCSEKDCAPYKGTVVETDKGFQLSDGRFVPYGDKRIRVSFDKEFHTCENSYNPLICLYVPSRGQ